MRFLYNFFTVIWFKLMWLASSDNHAKSSSFKSCWASIFKYSSSDLNPNSVFHIINQTPMSTTSFHNSTNLQDFQNFLIPHVIGIIPYEWNDRNGLTEWNYTMEMESYHGKGIVPYHGKGIRSWKPSHTIETESYHTMKVTFLTKFRCE